ncbi:MAG TPA: GNAT family N-acetyltransferase [Gaiellaceae bacterium]|nr:GNAT family N-acetyltransferase [Gaiellaceae bacterium]
MRLRAPDPPLSDGVVLLRPWSDADTPAVAAACRDPEIARWIDDIPAPYTRADARAYVAACRRGWKEGSLWAFAVTDAATGDVVGSCGIAWQDPTHGVAEIGYWVRADDRGRGVATRAVRLASAWAFETGGVERLQLRADVLNTASQKVAEKAGFQREGVLRSVRYSRRQQRRVDFVMFSRLAGEQRAVANTEP